MRKLTALLLLLALLAGCTAVPPEETESTLVPETSAPAAAVSEQYDCLTVHFIDVGQADCALLECDNAFAIIDGGNTADGEMVVEYLQEQGVRRLNLVVGTHPHEDHIGGLPEVLEAFPADNIWFSAMTYQNTTVNAFLDGAKKQDKEIFQPQPGQTFQLGDAVITVLGPDYVDYENTNNLSLVLMVEYGDTRFLFTGDMEREAELKLVENGVDLKADVLKVGHHGSYTSTSYLFLREVAPTYAVISVGAANDYGHPHDDPMSRLRDADVIIYRTDSMYNIQAVSDGQTITFSWDNTYAEPWMPNAA